MWSELVKPKVSKISPGKVNNFVDIEIKTKEYVPGPGKYKFKDLNKMGNPVVNKSPRITQADEL